MTDKELNRRAARIKRELCALLKALKRDIGDEYRAQEDDTLPGMQITIGVSADLTEWSYQTGDNSYTGGAYGFPYWGVGVLYRRSNSRNVARDIVDDAVSQIDC